MANITQELKALGDELKTAWDGFKADADSLEGRVNARINELEDTFNVRTRKMAQGGYRGRRPEAAGLGGKFLSLDEPLSAFAAETPGGLSASDAEHVRFGALVAAIAGGKNTFSHLNEYELRAVENMTGPGGSYLVPEVIGSIFVDAVRPHSRVHQAGALTYELEQSTVHFPGFSEPITASWRPEHGEIVEDDVTFRRITLQAKLVGCYVTITREHLEDSGQGFELLKVEMARALAHAVDLAALVGTGTETEPFGVLAATRQDGRYEVLGGGANGDTPADYDFLLDAMYEVEASNFEPTGLIWNPRTANTLRKLTTGISGDKTKLEMPAEVKALPRFATNQVPINAVEGTSSDCSYAFVGQWDQMVIGYRPTVAMTLVDPYTRAGNAEIRLFAWLRADVGLLNRSAFFSVQGIRP